MSETTDPKDTSKVPKKETAKEAIKKAQEAQTPQAPQTPQTTSEGGFASSPQFPLHGTSVVESSLSSESHEENAKATETFETSEIAAELSHETAIAHASAEAQAIIDSAKAKVEQAKLALKLAEEEAELAADQASDIEDNAEDIQAFLSEIGSPQPVFVVDRDTKVNCEILKAGDNDLQGSVDLRCMVNGEVRTFLNVREDPSGTQAGTFHLRDRKKPTRIVSSQGGIVNPIDVPHANKPAQPMV